MEYKGAKFISLFLMILFSLGSCINPQSEYNFVVGPLLPAWIQILWGA